MTHPPLSSWRAIVTAHARTRLRERWPKLSIESDHEAAAMLEFFIRNGIVMTGRQVSEMLMAKVWLRRATELSVFCPVIQGVVPVKLTGGGTAHALTVFPVEVRVKYRELVDSLKEDLVA